jgi:hypothetical protein
MTTSRQRGNGLAFSVNGFLFLGHLRDSQLSASHKNPRSMELTCNQLNPISDCIIRILKRAVTRWCYKFLSVSCHCQSVHWTHKLSVWPHRHHGVSTSVASQRGSRLCFPTRIPLSVSDFPEATTGRQAAGPQQLAFTRTASLDTAWRRADLQNNPEAIMRRVTEFHQTEKEGYLGLTM